MCREREREMNDTSKVCAFVLRSKERLLLKRFGVEKKKEGDERKKGAKTTTMVVVVVVVFGKREE